MSTQLTLRKTLAVFFCMLFFLGAAAQDKDIAKVDDYIAKAKEETDPAKKNDNYQKAAKLIMTKRLGKEQYIKLGDAYLDEGDVSNASRYYMRCDKEDKYAGYVKVGHKMIEQALEAEDRKEENKMMRKAISYFQKGKAGKEGYEAVGDAYYAQGMDFYMKAAKYYGQGKVTEMIDKIAEEYLNADQLDDAADVFMMLNNEEGYKKAGDLYYSVGDYNSAYAAYEKGEVTEGIKKYGDKLYDDGQMSDGDAMYIKVAQIYTEKGNTAGIMELANASEDHGHYSLAAELYESAGNTEKANLARAYDMLLSLDFTSARAAFETLQDEAMVKAIDANMKYLSPLKEIANYFDEVKSYQPYVSYTRDTVTKKRVANQKELDAFYAYYKGIASNIADNCYKVSANLPKINDDELKAVMMNKFLHYGAVRNLLDKSFSKKLEKSQITAKDVVL